MQGGLQNYKVTNRLEVLAGIATSWETNLKHF